MARADTTEGQALQQPGRAKEDSCFRARGRHLHLAYDDEGEELQATVGQTISPVLRATVGILLRDGAVSI